MFFVSTFSLNKFWISIFSFLSLLGIGGFFFSFVDLFLTNVVFNGVIALVWLLGVIFVMGTLMALARESRAWSSGDWRRLKLLRPLAQLYEKNPRASREQILYTLSYIKRSQSQGLLRYWAGSLIFMGLLGTLWGLSKTVLSMAQVIGELPVQGVDKHFFQTLKNELGGALGSMGVAFSSSLFGIGGSASLGFLMALCDQARQAFFSFLERQVFQIFSPGPSEEVMTNGQKAFQELLWPWLESVEKMTILMHQAEQRHKDWLEAVLHIHQKTQQMTDAILAQKSALQQWNEGQALMQATLEVISQRLMHQHQDHLPRLSERLIEVNGQSKQTLQLMQELTSSLARGKDGFKPSLD